MGGSGFLKEIPAGFEETCPFLIVTMPQGRPKVGAGGPMDALEGSRLCGETVPFGAAVGCTVQLTQSTEERGSTGLGEAPSVHGETTWLHVCAPPGPAPCLAHTRCPDNTTAPRTHASSQFHAMDSLCDLENASLLPSVKWGSQYSPWSVLKIKT